MTVLRCTDDPYDRAPAEDFDPVEFHCHHGDYARAAAFLRAGEDYRKSVLGLDKDGVRELRHHLATHGLALVDDETHWVVAEAGESDAEGPDEACRRAGQRASHCDCGHRAGDHDGDGGACTYRDFAGQLCPCTTFDPDSDRGGSR
jgi:hypothetical protein